MPASPAHPPTHRRGARGWSASTRRTGWPSCARRCSRWPTCGARGRPPDCPPDGTADGGAPVEDPRGRSARAGRQRSMTATAVLEDGADVRRDAERHLRALVGRDDAELREDQWRAIEALAVERRRALVVQRTGWGKSAVYFVATLLLRAGGSGPTVIVSPLLALMRNQIAAAERAGIRAVTI